jgi:hypothetical protein
MNTGLFVLTRGFDPGLVEHVVPPACRSNVTSAGAPDARDGEWLIDTGPWRPRERSRHFVPALSMLTPDPVAFRFELAVEIDGHWSPWVASAAIGGDGFPPELAQVMGLSCDVDVFTSATPVDRVALRARVRRSASGSTPWLLTLSACDLAPLERSAGRLVATKLAVPSRSQMIEPEEIRRRICSPTSVAMVLEHWGRRVDTVTVAADSLVADRYGVWPAAVAAAARRGVAGYLLRFPDWTSAAWCLTAGLPIVASVRYGPGELPGAAMQETDGHLVGITGADGDDVFLNDPAAATVATGPCRVRRDAFERVWLERAGIGYVFFLPAGGPDMAPRPPRRSPRPGGAGPRL